MVEILKYDHTDKNFRETAFIPFKAFLTYGSIDEILKWEHSRRKLLRKPFPVVSHAMQSALLTFQSMDKIQV